MWFIPDEFEFVLFSLKAQRLPSFSMLGEEVEQILIRVVSLPWKKGQMGSRNLFDLRRWWWWGEFPKYSWLMRAPYTMGRGGGLLLEEWLA